MAMFEGGFLPGFFNFLTMNLFDGIPGNTNWPGLIGLILVMVWIIYRISSNSSKNTGGGSGNNYYKG